MAALQHCENNINDCLGVTCPANKMCYDGVAGYECSCPPGFSGEDCAQQIDDCQGDPCQNGGHCQDLVEGYRLVTCFRIRTQIHTMSITQANRSKF